MVFVLGRTVSRFPAAKEVCGRGPGNDCGALLAPDMGTALCGSSSQSRSRQTNGTLPGLKVHYAHCVCLRVRLGAQGDGQGTRPSHCRRTGEAWPRGYAVCLSL